jgi:hypothetical protein
MSFSKRSQYLSMVSRVFYERSQGNQDTKDRQIKMNLFGSLDHIHLSCYCCKPPGDDGDFGPPFPASVFKQCFQPVSKDDEIHPVQRWQATDPTYRDVSPRENS